MPQKHYLLKTKVSMSLTQPNIYKKKKNTGKNNKPLTIANRKPGT